MAKSKLACSCSHHHATIDLMNCQAPTVPAPMPPPSSPLVKFPLLPHGLLSYLPANLSSILPRGASRDAAATSSLTLPTLPPALESPNKKMSPLSGARQVGRLGSKRPSADTVEMARVFELFDRNGDGLITPEELEDSLGNLGIPPPADELTTMIAHIDTNGDGCVDVEEFGELYRAIMARDKDGGAEEEKEEEDGDMRKAFWVFDANGDGYITVDELGAVLASLGLKQGHTVEECRCMISQVDSDGDGRVDFHEFL